MTDNALAVLSIVVAVVGIVIPVLTQGGFHADRLKCKLDYAFATEQTEILSRSSDRWFYSLLVLLALFQIYCSFAIVTGDYNLPSCNIRIVTFAGQIVMVLANVASFSINMIITKEKLKFVETRLKQGDYTLVRIVDDYVLILAAALLIVLLFSNLATHDYTSFWILALLSLGTLMSAFALIGRYARSHYMYKVISTYIKVASKHKVEDVIDYWLHGGEFSFTVCYPDGLVVKSLPIANLEYVDNKLNLNQPLFKKLATRVK